MANATQTIHPIKEIWFNDAFPWKTDANASGIDIETVALHENGHAFELGHFGAIFVTEKNNKLHFAPRAVMNAACWAPTRAPSAWSGPKGRGPGRFD